MSKDVISVKQDETLKIVFELMDKHGILGIPVVDEENRVVGIITETDLLSHLTTLHTPIGVSILGSLIYLDSLKEFNEKLKDHCAEFVKDMMTKDVITLNEDQTLHEVIDLMAEKKISRLPVLNDKGQLSGIVTRSDVVHQLAQIKAI